MTTFTDENSALGDLGSQANQLSLSFLFPGFIGILISSITYVVCRATGVDEVCISVGLLIGLIIISLYFVSEKERHMLVEDETSCVSDDVHRAPEPGAYIWLKYQCLFLVSAVPLFVALVFFGDPVFQLYLQLLATAPLQ